ncbi:hypothetical protein J7355_16795 [Endozoicomonas sp. G2_2]|uniref:hypothetical protein n=1 Tax=Endozoicomonas sp. G2_2 TaxID=2821092 RepID=UPI001AD987BC|nr:hypothetical protein [Endozoicomonas sp. G2_2]MBO9471751.1 hypothetical protein [Endozoicomonas sp. G2_2]
MSSNTAAWVQAISAIGLPLFILWFQSIRDAARDREFQRQSVGNITDHVRELRDTFKHLSDSYETGQQSFYTNCDVLSETLDNPYSVAQVPIYAMRLDSYWQVRLKNLAGYYRETVEIGLSIEPLNPERLHERDWELAGKTIEAGMKLASSMYETSNEEFYAPSWTPTRYLLHRYKGPIDWLTFFSA